MPNVVHYWGVFRRAKWSLLGWTLAFALSGVAAAVTTPNTYEATVLMMASQSRRIPGGGNLPLSLLRGLGFQSPELAPDSFAATERALIILKSRDFLSHFVKKRQLMRKLYKPSDFDPDASDPDASDPDEARDIPAFQSTVAKLQRTYGEFRQHLSTKVEELMRKLYKPSDFDRETLRDSAPTSQGAYRKIKRAIAIERKPRTGLTIVKVRWKDPVVAAEWANALIADLNSALREMDIAEARKRIAYLNRALDETSVIPLRQSIYRLMEAEIRSIMIAETRTDYAFRVIDSAVPPEPDQPIRPRRDRMIWTTAFMGFGIGAFWTVWRDSIRMLRGLGEGSRAVQ